MEIDPLPAGKIEASERDIIWGDSIPCRDPLRRDPVELGLVRGSNESCCREDRDDDQCDPERTSTRDFHARMLKH